MAKTRIHDGKAPDISKLQTELNKLRVSGANNPRLKEIEKRLNYIFYGIK